MKQVIDHFLIMIDFKDNVYFFSHTESNKSESFSDSCRDSGKMQSINVLQQFIKNMIKSDNTL